MRKGTLLWLPYVRKNRSYRSGAASAQLFSWAMKDGTGRAFDATSVFNLPSGAKRQPDAAWIPRSVLSQENPEALKTVTKTRHVPTFLIEVTSASDTLDEQRAKCLEWIAAGVQEVFLLHPTEKLAAVFTPQGEQRILNAKSVISSVLDGFVLECGPIWEELV